MKIFRIIIIAVMLAGMVLSSCTRKMDLVYFTNIDSVGIQNLSSKYLPRIQPEDELKILVNSEVPAATAMFNLPVMTSMERTEEELTSIQKVQTYIVDPDGFINFPVLGKLHVAGLTLNDLQNLLTEKIGETVKDPIVSVDFTKFRVVVLGEVTKPGTKEVKTRRYTVLDAIGDAEDITIYGRRDNVLVVRQENGKAASHRLDLTKAESLTSPYFYLQQNDMVYVEANEVRKSTANADVDRTYRLQVVIAVVSAISVAASLLIALVVRK